VPFFYLFICIGNGDNHGDDYDHHHDDEDETVAAAATR